MPAVRVPQSLPAAGPLSPVAKLRLVSEVLRTFHDVRRRMHEADVRDLLVQLRSEAPGPLADPSPHVLHDALRLGRAVSRTLGPLPVDATCLARSLVLVAMLARRGLPGTLVIGVQPGGGEATAAPRGLRLRNRLARGEAPEGGGFAAHAWVEVGGQPVLAPGDFARLTEL